MRTKQTQSALRIFPELKESSITKKQLIDGLRNFKSVKTFNDNSNEFIFYSTTKYFAIAAYDINTGIIYLHNSFND